MKTSTPMSIDNVINFLLEHRRQHPMATKYQLATVTAKNFRLTKERSVWTCSYFSIRFSTANENSFSNVVLSLSALKKYDNHPFIVCIVKPSSLEFLLANTTFLKKISHSSHRLAIDNIRGSFLGNDIMRNYDNILNHPENFEKLFSIHREFGWEENLERLVEATGNIAAHGNKYMPSEKERENILNSADIASKVISRKDYSLIKEELIALVLNKENEILSLAEIDNVNERGNKIEQVITGTGNAHSFEDLTRTLNDGLELKVEIKSTLLDKSSAPKAYNIDKLLKILSNGGTVCVFCFVGIELSVKRIYVQVASIFDETILEATRIQFHWAGRNSRGVTQLTGDFSILFLTDFNEHIDIAKAKAFLNNLMRL